MMKRIFGIFLFLAAIGLIAQTITRISQYPNTNTLAGTNLFVIAIKGSPGTNMNISWEQFSNILASIFTTTNIPAANITNAYVDLMQIAIGWITNTPFHVISNAATPQSIHGSGGVTVSSNTATGAYTIGYSGAGISMSDVTNGAPLAFDDSVGSAGDLNAAGVVTAGGTNLYGAIVAGTNDAYAYALARGNTAMQTATNYANGVTNSSIVRQTELTTVSNNAIGGFQASTNYAAATANNVSNWVNAVSNRLDSFSTANSNQATAVLQASTNYAASTANNVSNWVNAVSNRLETVIPVATNLITGADQTIALSSDTTVCITNAVAGAVNVWFTNAVDRKTFVLRCVANGSARTLSFTNASGLTLNVISTNGFSVTTLPQFPVTASKIGTVAGRVWVVAGVTNVDIWGAVQP